MRRLILVLAAAVGLVLGVAPPATTATYWVQYPFVKDSIPVYNALGVYGTGTAAFRWENGTGINLWTSASDPASGISLRWSSARAGSSVGGWVSSSFHWNGTGWQVRDCTVYVNTYVGGAGRPYGKWLYAIVTHEVGHCLGHYRHAASPEIMRPFISKAGTLAGYGWLPTSTDLSRMRAGFATN